MFESTADEGRSIPRQAALVLLAAVTIAILDIRLLVLGRAGGPAPVSALITAVFCFAAMFHWKDMLSRVALGLIGLQAVISLILNRTRVSIGWLHIANVAGRMAEILGVVIIIFVIVKWFGSSRREKVSL